MLVPNSVLSQILMVFNQVFIQKYFPPEDFFYVFIRLLSQVFIRDAPGISEKDENRSKSTKVTKVTAFEVSYKLIIQTDGPRWIPKMCVFTSTFYCLNI